MSELGGFKTRSRRGGQNLLFKFDLIYCYKIVVRVVDLNFSDFFLIQLGNCYEGPFVQTVQTKLC